MPLLAITGSLGTGKSTLARALTSRGVIRLDTDRLSAWVVQHDDRCQRSLQKLLPLSRPVTVADLRHAIVRDPSILRQLEDILHPAIAQRVQRAARQHRQRLVIVEVPLLFEAGWQNLFDRILCATASPFLTQQRRHARVRNGGNPVLLAHLQARQWPSQRLEQQADAVVRTGLSLRHTRAQAQRMVDDWFNSPRPR